MVILAFVLESISQMSMQRMYDAAPLNWMRQFVMLTHVSTLL